MAGTMPAWCSRSTATPLELFPFRQLGSDKCLRLKQSCLRFSLGHTMIRPGDICAQHTHERRTRSGGCRAWLAGERRGRAGRHRHLYDLVNWQEFAANTNPNSRDTDGDGYDDGVEVSRGSNPTLASSIPRVSLMVTSQPLSVGQPSPLGSMARIKCRCLAP